MIEYPHKHEFRGMTAQRADKISSKLDPHITNVNKRQPEQTFHCKKGYLVKNQSCNLTLKMPRAIFVFDIQHQVLTKLYFDLLVLLHLISLTNISL